MAKARDRLKLLQPCLALRELRVLHARSQAIEARQLYDRTQSELLASQRRSGLAAALLSQQSGRGDLAFTALEHDAARAAVRVLRGLEGVAAQQCSEAELAMDRRKAEVLEADSARTVLARDFVRTRRRVSRDDEERHLAVVEDLVTARRKHK